MQIVYDLIHFEPRDIKHRSVVEITAKLNFSR